VSRAQGVLPPAVFASDRPLIFAHRGGAKIGPENTMEAFARGLAAGADGFECDVRLSADGVPVVVHDATLDRTTDRTGPVAVLTAAELAGVDATCRFVPAAGWPAPRRMGISTLADVLAAFPTARFIVEIKDTSPADAVAEAVAAVVRSAGAVDRVCLGSFDDQMLRRVRAHAPEITTSASQAEARRTLMRSWIRWPIPAAPSYRGFQVPVSAGRVPVVTPAFVRRAHRERAVVQVWTVDAPDEVRRLFDMGVDGIITDRPDLTVPARDAWAADRARR
jgi:glycerophosphoryl diester phosphodiesterase